METLKIVQRIQLGVLEAAYLNENSAADLMGVLHLLPPKDAEIVIDIVFSLQAEADKLKTLSRDIMSKKIFIYSNQP